MICPRCQSEMVKDDIEVGSPSHPDDTRHYVKMWCCTDCDHREDIEPDENDEYDPDLEM